MAHDEHNARDAHVTMGDTDSLKATAAGQLVHLDDLDDFQIAAGEPDIRGWDVRGTDGNKLGEVADLLVDTAAMKVRYIEVKLDKDVARDMGHSHHEHPHHAHPHDITDSAMRAEGEHDTKAFRSDAADAGRFVLIPIGVARLDDDSDDVVLDAQASQLVGIPAYRRDGKDLTRDYENEVVRGYSAKPDGSHANDVMRAAVPSDAQTSTRDKFYEDRSFDDRSFFGSRRRGRDDDAYFTRADQDGRARDRQSGDRAINSRNDDMNDDRPIREELDR